MQWINILIANFTLLYRKLASKLLTKFLVINKYLLLLAFLLSLTAFCISTHLHTYQSVIGMIVGANKLIVVILQSDLQMCVSPGGGSEGFLTGRAPHQTVWAALATMTPSKSLQCMVTDRSALLYLNLWKPISDRKKKKKRK